MRKMHCPPSRPPPGGHWLGPSSLGAGAAAAPAPVLPQGCSRPGASVLGRVEALALRPDPAALLCWGDGQALGQSPPWSPPHTVQGASQSPPSLSALPPLRPLGPGMGGGSPRMDPAPSYYLLESPAEERWLVPPQGSRSLWTGQPTHLPAPLRAPPPAPPLPPHPHPVPFFCIWKQRVVINLRWMFSPGLWLPLSSGWCWGVTGWGGVFPGPGRWAVGPGTPPTARHPEPSGQVGQGGGGGGV